MYTLKAYSEDNTQGAIIPNLTLGQAYTKALHFTQRLGWYIRIYRSWNGMNIAYKSRKLPLK